MRFRREFAIFRRSFRSSTHHASADRGSGFCVFNDIAVAARALQREGLIERVLVVDLDVHQGDGTAAIFAGDESVFTFSMHGAKNFPFQKQRSSLDVALPDGCSDSEYIEALECHLPGVLDRSRPDILFFQAGVDPLEHDLLGRLRVSLDGLHARDRIVARAARQCGIPLVLTLGGGYARPISLSEAISPRVMPRTSNSFSSPRYWKAESGLFGGGHFRG